LKYQKNSIQGEYMETVLSWVLGIGITIVALMAITLFTSVLFNAGDGTIVLTTHSPLYMMRYIILYPLGAFLSVVSKDIVKMSTYDFLGRRIIPEAIPIPSEGLFWHRFHPATHNMVIKETSLCGAFWKSILSLIVVLPLDIIMLPFITFGFVMFGVIAVIVAIGWGVGEGGMYVGKFFWKWTTKIVVQPFKQLAFYLAELYGKYLELKIDSYFDKVGDVSPEEAAKETIKFREQKKNPYTMNDYEKAIIKLNQLFKPKKGVFTDNISTILHYYPTVKTILDRYAKKLTPKGKNIYLACLDANNRFNISNSNQKELVDEFRIIAAKEYLEYTKNLTAIIEESNKEEEQKQTRIIKRQEAKQIKAVVWKNRWEIAVKFYKGWLCPKVKFVSIEEKGK
jgi:hypothetical protein